MCKMRLTSTPTNQGMVPGVSQKYKIRYFRPNEGEEWLPVALVGFQVFSIPRQESKTVIQTTLFDQFTYKTMSERTAYKGMIRKSKKE